MFSWLTNPNILLAGQVLGLLQVLAALPWLRAVDPRGFNQVVRSPAGVAYTVLGILGIGLAFAAYLGFNVDSEGLLGDGRKYAVVLHLQLLLDLFVVLPALLTLAPSRRVAAGAGAILLAVAVAYQATGAAAWASPLVTLLVVAVVLCAAVVVASYLIGPKTGAIAVAAFREGCRQPLFWLVTVFAVILTWVAVVIPYFTFGDDFKMMKQIGFDIVMLAAVLFGVLAASISVSEEIEGRTALTVMSKPVNRRQFFLGKYLGILLACGGMTLLLGLNLNAACLANPEFDPINKDRAYDPMPEEAKAAVVPMAQSVIPPGPGKAVAVGAGLWLGETLANSLGLLLGFGQVMILVAVATALATRLPFVVNLVLNLVLYLLGHLAPVIVRVTETTTGKDTASVGLVRFLGNLFDTLLPALEFFNMGPAIIRDTPLGLVPFAGYVVTVSGYAVLYTIIALLIGLLLFEDRDLA